MIQFGAMRGAIVCGGRGYGEDRIRAGGRWVANPDAAMLAKALPAYVIAFPGGDGTADMLRQARAAGVHVYEVP